MSKRVLLAGCVSAAAMLIGCSGSTKSGTEYTITPLREFKATLPHDLESTHRAAVQAIEGLGYTIHQNAADAIEASIEAKTATDRTVTVKSRRVGDDSTEVLVGVSPLGNEEIARQVLGAIEDELN